MAREADETGNDETVKSPSSRDAMPRVTALEDSNGGCNPQRRLARATTPDLKLAKLIEAGTAIAASLRNDSKMHQERAAVLSGVSRRSYYEYLDGEDEACQAFQALVLPALYEQAEANLSEAEKAIGSAENGSSAWAGWHKWLMEKRYRKIYGDLAQEVNVQLTGKDGGPVQLDVVTQLSDAELRKIALGDG